MAKDDRLSVMVTCPPMLGMIDEFRSIFDENNIEVYAPEVVQTLSEDKLLELVPLYDGWIIGDDPATREVFVAGAKGRLKAAVKWGIGVDNVDYSAAEELNIPITNTPNMFGSEVADVAMAYVTGLARQLFFIDEEVKKGEWPKPRGVSLAGKKVGLVGYGDIGKSFAVRAIAADMDVVVCDPVIGQDCIMDGLRLSSWEELLAESDFIVFTCSLNPKNRHMFNKDVVSSLKEGVNIINVARGPLIDEEALMLGIDNGKINAVALDVFEDEPLPMDSPLRSSRKFIFGSHNASNTVEGVRRTSYKAINCLLDYFRNIEEKS